MRDGDLGKERQFKLSVLEEPTTNHHGNTEGGRPWGRVRGCNHRMANSESKKGAKWKRLDNPQAVRMTIRQATLLELPN